MKKNLISAIAGWKSAALLALVAMVATVAFSGVLTSTSTADAAGPGDTADVVSGTLTAFTTDDGIATFTITGGTSTGSFAANGGQTLVCANADATCDTDDVATTVTVKLAIDDDSPNGFILVKVDDANSANSVTRRVDVSTADRVTSIKASAPTPNPAVSATGTDTVVITATLQNSVEGGVNGKPVIIFTTLGLLDGCGDQDDVQACSENSAEIDDGDAATTDDNGKVQVTLQTTGRAGVATVSFTTGTLNATVDVVFYGTTAEISAAAMQSSIAIGGGTYIVVTAIDSGGNPVNAHAPTARAQGAAGNDADGDGVVGPGAKSIEVDANYDKDFVHPTDPKQNLPACGNEADDADTTDVDEGARFPNPGANPAGKCVIYVMAPGDPTAPNPAVDATRGVNTVHIAGPGATTTDRSKDVAVEISVGGAPADITTDAPARVDPLSSTKITITVVDDEGVLVGAVSASVDQVEGDGKVLDPQVSGTNDGTASFTYLAPNSPGTAVFRIAAGAFATNLVIHIGDAAPEAPSYVWGQPLSSGTHNLVWQGEDGADPSAGAGDGVSAIWRWDGSTWLGYFPNAADVPGGNNLGSLENGTAYFVVVD